MTTKILKVLDSNLTDASYDPIREELGGYWTASETEIESNLVSPNDTIALIESDYLNTNEVVDLESLITSTKYASRIYADPASTNIRSSQEWLAYVVGGSYGSKTYDGIYDDVARFDHASELTFPIYNDELQSDNDDVSGYSKAEYYKYYDVYQANLENINSELLLPNFYFLKEEGLDDIDIIKMITLENSLEEDYFNYSTFAEELEDEQPGLVTAARLASAAAVDAAGGEGADGAREAGAEAEETVLYRTEVSDPDSGAINTLFSNVTSDKDVPRYQYNNIKKYLNTDYVNHTYSDYMKERLESRLQNIFFLEPNDLRDANEQQIATDFSYLEEEKRKNLYSLMPMSQHIYFETDRETMGIRSAIHVNDYTPRFIKTLKEVFSDEISLKPTSLPFFVRNDYTGEGSEVSLNVIDLPELILFDYNNLISRTSNCYYFGTSTESIRACFDETGAHRFVNSEIAANCLNDIIANINLRFNPPQDISSFLDGAINENKKHETIVYRVQKIGGEPTGDSRTENTIQNFWFVNKVRAIEYVDTQVKYGTDYTYNIFAYTAILGYKYKLSDLLVTRQIAQDEDKYCLEFFDPLTSEAAKNLLDSSSVVFNFPRTESNIEQFSIIKARLERLYGLLEDADSAASTGTGMFASTAEEVTDEATTGTTTTEVKVDPDEVKKSIGNIQTQLLQLLTDSGIESFLSTAGIAEFTAYDPTITELPQFIVDFFANLLDGTSASLLVSFSELEQNTFFTDAQINSFYPHLADFNIYVEPSLKIVEVPIQQKTFKILDNPANQISVTPYHTRDQSNRLTFFLSDGDFTPNENEYPVALTEEDDQNKTDYLTGNDLEEDDKIESESVSKTQTFEVYRLSEKPRSYQDFENNLRQSIDLRILKNNKIKLDSFFSEKVRVNQKYYYTFRAVNENGIAGEFSQIYESELINDGGYVYANFKQYTEDELEDTETSEPLMQFKKLFNVVPNIQQLIINPNSADFTDSAFTQVQNFDLGVVSDSERIWGKTFKLRLTSKKTGKKIDLNIKFNNTKG